jgi:putative PIN family toxin of toxin-antitoxin system
MQVFACCELCASETALAELETVLNREKFARYLDLESRRAFISLIRRHAVIFHVGHGEIASVSPPCRDQKDSQFLALALAAEAEVLISSDGDLLVLHPWNGIAVLTPAQFDSRR